MSDVSQRVVKKVSEHLQVAEDQVVPGASFVDDLGADSLEIVELVMALEDEFNINIPDEKAEQIKTVKEVIDYIEEDTK